MAGGPKQEMAKAGDITNQQLNIASTQSQREADSYNQMKQLMNPYISQLSALASGNRSQALAASMPVLSRLSAGWAGSKANIMNSMPAGAARDRALSDMNTNMYTNLAGAQANAVQQAPGQLAGLGSEIGNYGLQQLGAALAALGGGSQTNQGLMQAKVQQQQSMLNFFGQLAGAAGGMVSPMKICWVAEAIYGVTDPRTFVVREYINGPMKQTAAGTWIWLIYRMVGKQIAWATRRSNTLRSTLKPLFDHAWNRALNQ